jgi:hypothetical protein
VHQELLRLVKRVQADHPDPQVTDATGQG